MTRLSWQMAQARMKTPTCWCCKARACCVPGRGPDKQTARAPAPSSAGLARTHRRHRLDQATSGLPCSWRHIDAQRRLSHAFAERQVHKRYQAVVWGCWRAPKAHWNEITPSPPTGKGALCASSTRTRQAQPPLAPALATTPAQTAPHASNWNPSPGRSDSTTCAYMAPSATPSCAMHPPACTGPGHCCTPATILCAPQHGGSRGAGVGRRFLKIGRQR